MSHTPALTFDPAAANAWLCQPSDTEDGTTRAESLGVDENLTGRGMSGDFLTTIDAVLDAGPQGWHRRADIDAVDLWLIPDGDVLNQGALITVDLTSGIRLCTRHRDTKYFADRDQRGTDAVLTALAHIANEVCLVVDQYQHSNPFATDATTPATTPGTAKPASSTPQKMFTEQQVTDALNEAADDILDAVDAGDDGLRDAINLMVNATIAYLTGQANDLREVVAHNYGDSYDEVLGWIEPAAR